LKHGCLLVVNKYNNNNNNKTELPWLHHLFKKDNKTRDELNIVDRLK
jgi:hypothetical protein